LYVKEIVATKQDGFLSKKYVKSQSVGCDYSEMKSPFFSGRGGKLFP